MPLSYYVGLGSLIVIVFLIGYIPEIVDGFVRTIDKLKIKSCNIKEDDYLPNVWTNDQVALSERFYSDLAVRIVSLRKSDMSLEEWDEFISVCRYADKWFAENYTRIDILVTFEEKANSIVLRA